MLSKELRNEKTKSWDNIFRLEGREPGYYLINGVSVKQGYDIQAVIPFILKEWIVDVEECNLGFPEMGIL